MSVPNNIAIPFFGVTFDGSQAGAQSSALPVQILVIAQKTSAGTATPQVPFIATTAGELAQKAGPGSMAHRKAMYLFKNNSTVPAWFVLLDDAGTATAGTHSFDITGAATESGELAMYINGQRYAVPVVAGDTNTDVLADLNTAATNDVDNLPCTTSVATNTLTAQMKNGGVAADDLDIRFAAARGEKIPAGLTISSVTKTAGTIDPDVGDALSNLGDMWFNVIDNPYSDNTNLTTVEEYMDSVADVMEQREGLAINVIRDTRSNLITFGSDTTNRNSKWVATYPAYGRRQATYELGSTIVGKTATSIQELASRPLHRQTLIGIDALDPVDRWTPIERNQLALNGISTISDELGAQLEATVTMYLKNSAGVDDSAFMQQNTIFTLSALRYRLRNQILTRYPRALLADAADNIGPGISIMTEDIARAEAINWFKDAQFDGLVDSSDAALSQFKEGLSVQRVGANRIEFLLPPDLMNQFIVGAGTIQFQQ